MFKVEHCRFLVPKILTEIWHHFWLKMMVNSGLVKVILKFNGGLQRYLLSCQANSAILGRYFCPGQQQLWRGSVNFKINSRPLFTIIFKLKNDNFKTRDFNPPIESVLNGVSPFVKHNVYLIQKCQWHMKFRDATMYFCQAWKKGIRMSYWHLQMVHGTDHLISCHWQAFLSAFSHL